MILITGALTLTKILACVAVVYIIAAVIYRAITGKPM